MTVQNEIPSNTFIAYEETQFLVDYYVYDTDELVVTLDGNIVNSNEYTIEENTEENDQGATITFYNAITGILIISRNTIVERTLNYNSTLNNITPSNLNYDFDRIYRIIQELGYKDTLLFDLLDKEKLARIQGDLELRSYIDSVVVNEGVQILDSDINTNILPSNKAIRTQQSKNKDSIHIKDFGAISDGTLHTLTEWVVSGLYTSLANIQEDYPFVTSLTESIDYVAIQAAINYVADKKQTVLLTGTSVINRTIQINKSIILSGSGIGTQHVFGRMSGSPDILVVGDGALCRSIKTRRNYREFISDAEDEELSVVLDVQADGVNIRDIHIHNIGTNWDVGIFSGTRLRLSCNNVAVTASDGVIQEQQYRKACIYIDNTNVAHWPSLTNWRGETYPTRMFNGSDGLKLRDCITWGGRWGIVVLGPKTKEGFTQLGRRYSAQTILTFLSNPIHNDSFIIESSQNITVRFKDVNSSGTLLPAEIVIPILPTLAETLAATVQALEEARGDTEEEESTFKSLTLAFFSKVGNTLIAYRSSFSTITETDEYMTTYGFSTSSSSFSLVNSGNPSLITTDPAPYYLNPTLGALPDFRGTFGVSDIIIDGCNIGGSCEFDRGFSWGVRRVDNDWSKEGWASGVIWLDNGPKLHKFKISNTRIEGGTSIFGVRLFKAKGQLDNVIADRIRDVPNYAPVGTNRFVYRYYWINREVNNPSPLVLSNCTLSSFGSEAFNTQLAIGKAIGDSVAGDSSDRGYLLGNNSKVRTLTIDSVKYGVSSIVNIIGGDNANSIINLHDNTLIGANISYFGNSKNFRINNLEGDVFLNAKATDTITYQFSNLNVISYHPTYAEPQYFYDLGTNGKPFNKIYAKEFIVSSGSALLGDFWDALDGA
jgi:hypothetical protein